MGERKRGAASNHTFQHLWREEHNVDVSGCWPPPPSNVTPSTSLQRTIWGVAINNSSCNNDDDDPRPGIVGSARGRAGREGKGRQGREEEGGREGKEGKGREAKGAGGISGANYFDSENGFGSNRSD